MSAGIDELVPVMEQVVELLDELVYLSESQYQALKQSSLEVVSFVAGQQEKVSRKLADLDLKGRQIVREWAEGAGWTVGSIAEFLPLAEEPVAARLSQLRDAILVRSQRLQELNQLNEALVRQGLKYTQKILGIVNAADPLVYNRLGDLHGAGSKTRVDTKF